MHTYVFGTHQGELPRHLVGHGQPGDHIRAMARLEGPDHDVIYALNHEAAESPELLADVLRHAGTLVVETFTLCDSRPCLQVLGIESHVVPIAMPPLEHILFLMFEADGQLTWPADVAPGEVAAATNGVGQFLVEFVGNDRQQLTRQAEQLLSENNTRAQRTYHASQLTRL
ncbi:MAG TPA: hypothetical protein VFT62_08395 [Mycobacteriales bacterium]|nr:hypothetical protein [Mycobacteriales bacterium]